MYLQYLQYLQMLLSAVSRVVPMKTKVFSTFSASLSIFVLTLLIACGAAKVGWLDLESHAAAGVCCFPISPSISNYWSDTCFIECEGVPGCVILRTSESYDQTWNWYYTSGTTCDSHGFVPGCYANLKTHTCSSDVTPMGCPSPEEITACYDEFAVLCPEPACQEVYTQYDCAALTGRPCP